MLGTLLEVGCISQEVADDAHAKLQRLRSCLLASVGREKELIAQQHKLAADAQVSHTELLEAEIKAAEWEGISVEVGVQPHPCTWGMLHACLHNIMASLETAPGKGPKSIIHAS